MARADKAAAVAELATAFRESQAAVLTEYRGLSVAELALLRSALGTTTTYSVVKNTLTKIAAREAGLDTLDDLLVGPSAIAFVQGDPVAAAKGLRDFARTHPLLIIKGGVLDGAALTAAELTRLADVESREVLLAKLAGAMKASLSGAAALFQAPLAQAARTVEALRAKLDSEPSADAAANPTDSGDSGDMESGDTDSGATDSGDTDSGDSDSGDTDSGDTDSGVTDSGVTDSGDAGAVPAAEPVGETDDIPASTTDSANSPGERADDASKTTTDD